MLTKESFCHANFLIDALSERPYRIVNCEYDDDY